MRILVGLAVFAGLLVLGFIAWLTGGSFAAFFAGIFLLGFAGAFVAGMAGVVRLPSAVRTLLGGAIALCLIVIVWAGISHWWRTSIAPARATAKAVAAAKQIARANTPASAVVVENPEPRFIRGVTPTKISADYEFNIEADSVGSVIRITYPDGQHMDYVVGKGCQQFPTPSYSGPKVFTDPHDPNGHLAFRLYRLKPGEGTCP